MDKECECADFASELRTSQGDDNFLCLARCREIVVVKYALNDDARGVLLGNHRGEGVHRRGGDVAVGNHCRVDHVRTFLEDGLGGELEKPMEFLERHWLSNGDRKCRVAINVIAEEDALCPGLGGEVHFALLHRDLPRRGFARGAGLGPDHLDGEHIAGTQQHFFRDSREREGF